MWAAACLISVTGCTTPGITASPATKERVATLLPADVVLLGEQHDAPDHQRVQREVVEALAAHGALAALALEMAEQGYATIGLASSSSEDQVRAALHWDNAAWPWPAYGPAVMAAVRSGVPVIGANLPRTRLREVMTDKKFDTLLPGPALKAQQQLIRHGHCDLLPESQISPMTRIQIARDVSMANTVASAAASGKTVLLLAGRGHVERSLGVPRHLPPALKVQAIGIGADQAPAAPDPSARFDLIWPAAPGPDIDHCEQFKARRAPQAGAGVRPAS